ncbi:uncharacterized protein IUM83_05757 [Phytophthora cinnamomi]|uniref:uncharacterized protein n=1 Tax=Phytophthora cinnamomi TaxID=4785 RepID=UPI003559511A|nr:hypothetical protein IUM83_05757 [Phytophthora cinnamomi]
MNGRGDVTVDVNEEARGPTYPVTKTNSKNMGLAEDGSLKSIRVLLTVLINLIAKGNASICVYKLKDLMETVVI